MGAMMRIQSKLVAATLAVLLLFTGTAQAFVGTIVVALGRAAEADPIKVEFSADAQVETEENKLNTKIFFKHSKLRDEMQMGGQTMVTIQRFDLDKSWVLMGQGMYMENALGESEQAPEYKLITKEVIGEEVVNGMQTTKYKTVYQGPKGKFGGFTWLNADNIAVKGFMIAEEDGRKQRIMFELSNIQVGNQDDALFELPPGSRKFDMGGIGNMMNSMSGGMPQAAPGPGASSAAEPTPDEQNAADEDSFTGEITEAAGESAKEATVDETKKAISEGVRAGFRSLFGKKP